MRHEWLIQLRIHDGDKPLGLDEYCRRCWTLVTRFARDFAQVPSIRVAGVGPLAHAATAAELEERMREGTEVGKPHPEDDVVLRQSDGAVVMAVGESPVVRLNLCHVAVEGGWPGYWWTQDIDIALRRGPQLKGSRGSPLAERWFDECLDIFSPTWARLVSLENGVAENFFPTSMPGTGKFGLGWLTYFDEDEYPMAVGACRNVAKAPWQVEARRAGTLCEVDRPWTL